MQLTQFTDYALRTLLYLHRHANRLSTISDIADWHRISKQHLVKVVHRLGQLGYIKSVQGRGGGISLAKPAADINIGQVVRDMEPHFHIAECFDRTHNTCRITDRCGLQHVLHAATVSFLTILDQHTLESIDSRFHPKPERRPR